MSLPALTTLQASLAPIIAPLWELTKSWAAALGVGGVLWTGYASSGLPIPATIHQVEERIKVVNDQIKGVRVEGAEGRREVIRLARISLRNEKGSIERVMDSLDTTAKLTMNRRVGEIEDQLSELEDVDKQLRDRIKELKPK